MVFLKWAWVLVVAVFLAACAPGKDFNYGMEQLNAVNSKYGTTMETYPDTTGKMSMMIDELSKLKSIRLGSGRKPFDYAVDYRILNIEAEKLYSESQVYGTLGTTKSGFSCKPRPLIMESAGLRLQSASKAFGAVETLRKFVKEYPKEASLLSLTEKDALFMNATFYRIEKEAKSDIAVINGFCPENKTLEYYKQEFRIKNLISDEDIDKLSYGEAVILWKKERGYS